MNVLHPSMFEYLSDLKNYATAYHSVMEYLDLVDPKNPCARRGETVSRYSPCGSIFLLRALKTNDLVGVRFVQPAGFMKRHGYAPLLFKDAKTLYSLYYDWLNEWVKQPAQLADPTACTLARQRHHELLLFLHDRLITTLMPKPVVSKTEEAWLKAPTLH